MRDLMRINCQVTMRIIEILLDEEIAILERLYLIQLEKVYIWLLVIILSIQSYTSLVEYR